MEIIDRLEQAKTATLRHFALAPDALDRSYGPGKWTVRYLLHHLADAEAVLAYRIRRVISEPRQVIWAFDQDAWARALEYDTVPLELSRRVYESSRDAIIHYARRHYAGSGAIGFVHSETGLRTLQDEFDKVVSHNRQHLDQIAKALETTGAR
jgi:hypothetical protein